MNQRPSADVAAVRRAAGPDFKLKPLAELLREHANSSRSQPPQPTAGPGPSRDHGGGSGSGSGSLAATFLGGVPTVHRTSSASDAASDADSQSSIPQLADGLRQAREAREAQERAFEEDVQRELALALLSSKQPLSEDTALARVRALAEHRIASVVKTIYPDDVFNGSATTQGDAGAAHRAALGGWGGAGAADTTLRRVLHPHLRPPFPTTIALPTDVAERYAADRDVQVMVDSVLTKELAVLRARAEHAKAALDAAAEEELRHGITHDRLREVAAVCAIKETEVLRLLRKVRDVEAAAGDADTSPAAREAMLQRLWQPTDPEAMRAAAVSAEASPRHFNRSAVAIIAGNEGGGAARGGAGAATSRGPVSPRRAVSVVDPSAPRDVPTSVATVLTAHKALLDAVHDLHQTHRTVTADGNTSAASLGAISDISVAPAGGSFAALNAADRSLTHTSAILRLGLDGPLVGEFAGAMSADPPLRSDGTASAAVPARAGLQETFLGRLGAARDGEARMPPAAQQAQRRREVTFATALGLAAVRPADNLRLEAGKLACQQLLVEAGPHLLGARYLELCDVFSSLAITRAALRSEAWLTTAATADADQARERRQQFEGHRDRRAALVAAAREQLERAHRRDFLARKMFATTYRWLSGQEALPSGRFLDPAACQPVVARIRAELQAGEIDTLLRLSETACAELLETPQQAWERSAANHLRPTPKSS